ncbi:WD repeat-containing protein 91 [Glossina fuscipes]|uniref:WD repeat-containing protein 91 n=1 Tax=Glossina fuscipes TaxID=7396 RepID=A0A9C5Z9C5_9MUSC|nr:WD repeat-containing protein 91 [Glossina fuscipes]
MEQIFSGDWQHHSENNTYFYFFIAFANMQVAFLDNLLKEYLVFRGFSNTLKALDSELKNEKDESFRAEKVMDQFNQSIQTHDLQSLLILWKHLDSYLFSKLEHTYSVATKKLENSLLKLYLVNAYNHNKTDKVSEFFSKLATSLQQQGEWKDWFYLPFCRNAEELPQFSLYFTKHWQDSLQLSLRNFLTTVYQCLPQPSFVHAEQESTLIRHLQEENTLLKYRLERASQQQRSTPQTTQINTSIPSGDNRLRSLSRTQHGLSDIQPFDVSPPNHVVDDFYIIASEVNSTSQSSDGQSRGLKMLIRNIGSVSSPGRGRRDNNGVNEKTSKRRSGSVGRNWI